MWFIVGGVAAIGILVGAYFLVKRKQEKKRLHDEGGLEADNEGGNEELYMMKDTDKALLF